MNIASIITETHANWHRGFLTSLWSKKSYTTLNYNRQPFNNQKDLLLWKKQGYTHKYFTGLLCDMNEKQPKYVNEYISWFERKYNAKNVGVSFYKMPTGVILPTHRDTYKKYRKLFRCKLKDCIRAIIFLDKWKPGHFFEIANNSIIKYRKGDFIVWYGNTPHMAANIGLQDRYTMQITGHR